MTKPKEIEATHKHDNHQLEKSLKNTFGWARVDVVCTVVVCTFLTSLCFSVVVEVIQTLFHIDHKDHVEHDETFHEYTYETCIILGALGLILNGISYLLIGGYTYHQGSFLHLTADGNVYIMDRVVSDGRKISETSEDKSNRRSKKIHELARDVCSVVVVIVASTIIVFCKENQSVEVRLIDPFFSLVSITILLTLSYPYMKEAAQILLQTIPENINIEVFQKEILQKFPEIQSIHDLHIWQLTQQKFVSTAHVIFLDPSVYRTTINDVLGYFHEQGINIVTIQPEFKNLGPEVDSSDEVSLIEGQTKDLCLVACRQVDCEEKLCCKKTSLGEDFEDFGDTKSYGNDIQLEQVLTVRNINAEDLNALTNYMSAKSLDGFESEDSVPTDIKKIYSSVSLHNSIGCDKYKLQKTVSVIDQEHQKDPSSSTSEDINLVSFKKFVSESVIKSRDNDYDCDILVGNCMKKQLDTTDNNEMEDLFGNCDRDALKDKNLQGMP